MKLLKNILLLLFIAPLFANAQNYKPSFVINLKGDTLKGFIDYKDWEYTPTYINFKQALNSQSVEKLTVNDINFFEISGYTSYKAFKVSISLDVTNLQKLQANKDTSSKVDNVFLKTITQGDNVTLYSYADNLKDRFYIYNSLNKSINELTYRIYYNSSITADNLAHNNNVKSEEAFKQQLLIIAQQFSTYRVSLLNQLERANYSESDLIDICTKINGNTTIKFKPSGSSGKFLRFFIGGGVAYNMLTSGGNFPIYAPDISSNVTSPFIDAGINLYRNPTVGGVLFRLEFIYSKMKPSFSGNLYYPSPSLFETYSFEQRNFGINPQLEFNAYNTDKLKAFINLGILYNMTSYSNTVLHKPSEQTDNYLDVGFNTYYLSFPIKGGVTLNKHYEFSLSYATPRTLNGIDTPAHTPGYTSVFVQTIKLGFNYVF